MRESGAVEEGEYVEWVNRMCVSADVRSVLRYIYEYITYSCGSNEGT